MSAPGAANGRADRATPPTPDELRREIDQTREDLSATVAALVAKTDVKARVVGRVQQWRTRKGGRSTVVLGAVAGAAAVALTLVLLRLLDRGRSA